MDRKLNKAKKQDVAQEARDILQIIQDTITDFSQKFNLDLSYLPRPQAFSSEDESILIEWIFSNFRIGFSIEPNSKDSSWYLVTKKELGEISASGLISEKDVDVKILVLWLLSFVLLHSQATGNVNEYTKIWYTI